MNTQRMLQAGHANYIYAEFTGENDSGEEPVGHHIIVKVDQVSDKVGKTGSIYVPDTTTKTNAMAVTTGVIVAAGPDAFVGWKGRKPVVGDRITFKRYEGEPFQNGAPFQYMPDTAVRGIHTSNGEPQS